MVHTRLSHAAGGRGPVVRQQEKTGYQPEFAWLRVEPALPRGPPNGTALVGTTMAHALGYAALWPEAPPTSREIATADSREDSRGVLTEAAKRGSAEVSDCFRWRHLPAGRRWGE